MCVNINISFILTPPTLYLIYYGLHLRLTPTTIISQRGKKVTSTPPEILCMLPVTDIHLRPHLTLPIKISALLHTKIVHRQTFISRASTWSLHDHYQNNMGVMTHIFIWECLISYNNLYIYILFQGFTTIPQ